MTIPVSANPAERLRLDMGLAKAQFLRLIGEPLTRFEIFTLDRDKLTDLQDARLALLRERWEEWCERIALHLADHPHDTWEFGALLGVSGWWVSKARHDGFLASDRREERGPVGQPVIVYGLPEWTAFLARCAAVVEHEGRQQGSLAAIISRQITPVF